MANTIELNKNVQISINDAVTVDVTWNDLYLKELFYIFFCANKACTMYTDTHAQLAFLYFYLLPDTIK